MELSIEIFLRYGIFFGLGALIAFVGFGGWLSFKRKSRKTVSVSLKAKVGRGVYSKNFKNVNSNDPKLTTELRNFIFAIDQMASRNMATVKLDAAKVTFGNPLMWIVPLIAPGWLPPDLDDIRSIPQPVDVGPEPQPRDGGPEQKPIDVSPDDYPWVNTVDGPYSESEAREFFEFVRDQRSKLTQIAREEGRGAILLAKDKKTGNIYDFRYQPNQKIKKLCSDYETVNKDLLRKAGSIKNNQLNSEQLILEAIKDYCNEVEQINLELDILSFEFETYLGIRIRDVELEEYIFSEIVFIIEQRYLRHKKSLKISEIDRLDRYNRINDLRDSLRNEAKNALVEEIVGEFLCIIKASILMRAFYAIYQIDGDRTMIR